MEGWCSLESSLVALVLMVVSAMNIDLGLPTCICALVITVVIAIRARTNPLRIVRRVSWSVLPLVAGLFILMEAMVWIGAMRYTAAALAWAEKLPVALGTVLTGTVVGFANNLVNNLPLGLIAGSTLNSAHVHGAIENAVLVGIDLGPNLSVTGSSGHDPLAHRHAPRGPARRLRHLPQGRACWPCPWPWCWRLRAWH